mgnify:CR=1 FL=1
MMTCYIQVSILDNSLRDATPDKKWVKKYVMQKLCTLSIQFDWKFTLFKISGCKMKQLLRSMLLLIHFFCCLFFTNSTEIQDHI